MRVLIAGASGFIGQNLVNFLYQSHDITVLGRNLEKLHKIFPSNKINKIIWDKLNDKDANEFDTIINLCGEQIAKQRWSKKFKQTLMLSRTQPTKTLLQWIINSKAHPHLVQANAIGIYGIQSINDTTALDENTNIDLQCPNDYMSSLATQWQLATESAITAHIPTTITRFGVVLSRKGGMLKQLYPSFFLGAGSILGTGQQIISWIHLEDLLRAIDYIIQHPEITGPINITSPKPVTQKKFATTLAKIIHRPLLLTLPALIIKMIFGEMGEMLLLNGQRVLPHRLQQLNFTFKYPDLEKALYKEFI